MKVEALKTIRITRYILGIFLVFVMVLMAEFSKNQEIIFPEICALIIGAWISEIEPWDVNKRRIFILMTLASIFGVLTVRYFPCPLIFQVCLCFMFTGVILTISKTNFVPIISACILPVYLKTTSLVYPISVSILTLVIIFIQYLMEKFHLRTKNVFYPFEFDLKKQVIKWSKLLFVFSIIAVIPFKASQIYFIAPPLIVMFTELSNPKSPMRPKVNYIISLMFLSSFLGCFIRIFFNLYLNFPLFICAILSCIILFYVIYKTKVNFPPLGAILLIPLLLDKSLLFIFPLEVLLGSAVLAYVALLIFKNE